MKWGKEKEEEEERTKPPNQNPIILTFFHLISCGTEDLQLPEDCRKTILTGPVALTTQEAEAKGTTQGLFELYGEFKASLSNLLIICLKVQSIKKPEEEAQQ